MRAYVYAVLWAFDYIDSIFLFKRTVSYLFLGKFLDTGTFTGLEKMFRTLVVFSSTMALDSNQLNINKHRGSICRFLAVSRVKTSSKLRKICDIPCKLDANCYPYDFFCLCVLIFLSVSWSSPLPLLSLFNIVLCKYQSSVRMVLSAYVIYIGEDVVLCISSEVNI